MDEGFRWAKTDYDGSWALVSKPLPGEECHGSEPMNETDCVWWHVRLIKDDKGLYVGEVYGSRPERFNVYDKTDGERVITTGQKTLMRAKIVAEALYFMGES